MFRNRFTASTLQMHDEYRSWQSVLWLSAFADLSYIDICTLAFRQWTSVLTMYRPIENVRIRITTGHLATKQIQTFQWDLS